MALGRTTEAAVRPARTSARSHSLLRRGGPSKADSRVTQLVSPRAARLPHAVVLDAPIYRANSASASRTFPPRGLAGRRALLSLAIGPLRSVVTADPL